MDPAQYYAEAPVLIPESEYVAQYQVIPAYDPMQFLRSTVSEAFSITFKSNEKGVKNPSQVVADDTLHCMPNKHVCVYLGKRIPPLDDGSLPRVHAYLKFADDKKRNTAVITCPKHRGDGNVLSSDSDDLIIEYDKTKSAYVLNFAYPPGAPEDVPSISLCFACSSSCFQRAVFYLHIDIVYPDIGFSHKHLVKVSANPGRDSGLPAYIVNEFARAKGAFTVTPKPRARKLTHESESQPSSKRSSGSQELQSETTSANGVYTITVYGRKPFVEVLNYYYMLTVSDKYNLMKQCPNQTAVLNSQIAPTAELDAFLEKAHMKKYKLLLSSQGIHTMVDLHKVYHDCYFESLNIPLEDAAGLHSSFIYWRTSYLHKLFNRDEDDSA